jgi:hypothetical protein
MARSRWSLWASKSDMLPEQLRTMRISRVTKEVIAQLAVATFVPIVPLALTMMPLEELLNPLLGVLF